LVDRGLEDGARQRVLTGRCVSGLIADPCVVDPVQQDDTPAREEILVHGLARALGSGMPSEVSNS
jgi:hypothetical protein